MKLYLILIAAVVCSASWATEPSLPVLPGQLISRPAYPVVRDSGYVLIEVWPRVKDITLTAFFLDDRDDKSRNLCEAVKKSLDRDAETQARKESVTATSYRNCMTIRDAARDGWLKLEE